MAVGRPGPSGRGSTAYTVYDTTEIGELRYLPWGKDRFASGQTLTTYKFTGQREEAGLGLYDYGARWYDPALGRFIQPDTIVPNPRDAQAFDRYAYVNNNPVKYTDPSGHCGVSALVGPPGLVFDLPCWGSGAGEAATVTVAGAVLAPVAAELAVNYVLNEPPVGIPPLYPGIAPDVEQGNILITVPIPDSTTLVSGVPLLPDETSPINGSSPGIVSQQVLADPLTTPQKGSNFVYTKPLGRGSTGKADPANLKQQLALEQATSNPAAGLPLPLKKGMTDPRWPASDGWVKMSQNINGIEIHYVYNPQTGESDDFKVK